MSSVAALNATQSVARLGRSKRVDACAAVSAGLGEPLAGSAGTTRAWLLLEHPGPWPIGAVEQAVGGDLVAEIQRRAPGVRVVLIRRSGGRDVQRPICVLVYSFGPSPWMRQARIGDYREVLDIDLEGLAAGVEPDFGHPRSDPLFTVCTHGKRDACCAEFGRPVLRAIGGEHDEAWECTHIGGDRFAANLVCFPHGLYYGHLNPISALSAANRYRDGRVQLANLRGRSGQPSSAQAAEHFVREATNLDGVADVVAASPIEMGDGLVEVVVSAGDRRFAVSLRREPVGHAVTDGCGQVEPVQRQAWALLGFAHDNRDGNTVQKVDQVLAPKTRLG
ncbi:hypothetical protein SAMN05216266_11069 [Amycolatopsis marina]|uniref:Sucrase/ferredoxin-like n=1 Tax=Amycolatopsis marina TaxID=490629 RepID=A0A1I1AQP2_9PSEU|nr:sucrase ferredoxin [Amycolatopsis marina]SFB40355.1 hypothetical protein SAMN05216266_11069 [Amycolatopsis marina]